MKMLTTIMCLATTMLAENDLNQESFVSPLTASR